MEMVLKEHKFLRKELILYQRIYKKIKTNPFSDISKIEDELKQLRKKYSKKDEMEYRSKLVRSFELLDLNELKLRAERLLQYYRTTGINSIPKDKYYRDHYFLLKVYKKRVGCDNIVFSKNICYLK